MEPIEAVHRLAEHVRSVVLPHLGGVEGRRHTGIAHSGDTTFHLDELAEAAVVEYIRQERLPVALYSEDQGLLRFGPAEASLIVDPVDGTRPAVCGLESCVVSVAWARGTEAPRMGDVVAGCVRELRGERAFLAERGAGARIRRDGGDEPLALAEGADLARLFWEFEMVARPAGLLFGVLEELIDRSSKGGGVFSFNSSAFALTRIVTGQLGAMVDLSGRLLREAPDARRRFAALSGGRPMGLYTYDIAAAWLIAQEAGATVTDASGAALDPVPLLDVSEANIQSCLGAANADLHGQILDAINRGFARLHASDVAQ